MFTDIVIKELRDHLLSLRFQAGFLLALVLAPASAFVLSADYQRRTAEHFQRERQLEDFARKYAHLNRIRMLLQPERPPSPLVAVRGLAADVGVETLDGDPMLELFAPMDLPAIVGVLFSLLAIVLGFDGVNGERETGTLRLILAGPVRRFTVLAGKWAGGMLVLGLAFAAAVLAGAGIVLAGSGAHWTGAEWLVFGAVCAASLLYCGAFFSLALLASTLARRSSVSVLISVFGWVMLVLVAPNVSPYLAAQFVRQPPVAALERDLRFITSEERDQAGNAGAAKLYEKYRNLLRVEPRAEHERRLASDPSYRRTYEQYRAENQAVWDEANRRQTAKAMRLYEQYRAVAGSQFRLSKRISYASPLPPLIYAATDLSLAGFQTRQHFSKQADAYDAALNDYLTKRYAEEQRKNAKYSWNDFMDVSTRPRFVYSPPRFWDRLDDALPFFGMLAAWNAVFFVGAAMGFARFDVRS